jgi:hypothetical protein
VSAERWTAPVVVGSAITLVLLAASSPRGMTLAIGAVIAGLLLAGTLVRPDRAVLALAIGLPFQVVILAMLYRYGVPREGVRLLTFWKETLIFGLALAALIRWRRNALRVDLLDGLAAGLLGFVILYYLFPGLTSFGSRVGSQSDRFLALRTAAGYLVLFLAVRRLPDPERLRRRVAGVAIISAVVLGAGAILEWSARGVWRTLTLDWLGIYAYRKDVLGLRETSTQLVDLAGGGDRYGSFLYSFLALSFFLLIGWALLVARQREEPSARVHVAMVFVGAAIVLAGTRSVMVVAAALLLVPFVRPRRAAHPASAARVAAIVVLVLLGLQFAVRTGQVDRFTAEGAESSTAHEERPLDALGFVLSHPLGGGLGASPLSTRTGAADDAGTVTAENAYLQVGAEFGVVPMVLFVALVGFAIRSLRWRARDDSSVAGWALTLIGLAIVGLVLHVFLDFTVTATAWIGVAASLSLSPRLAGVRRVPAGGRGRSRGSVAPSRPS